VTSNGCARTHFAKTAAPLFLLGLAMPHVYVKGLFEFMPRLVTMFRSILVMINH
jgi:hypothetical protein